MLDMHMGNILHCMAGTVLGFCFVFPSVARYEFFLRRCIFFVIKKAGV